MTPREAREEDARREVMLSRVELRVGPAAERFRRALLSVDRARFVRPEDRGSAWLDEPLPLDTPHGDRVATISAPHVYVLGFDALELDRGDRLLELGSGSGYGAALAAFVVGPEGRVTTVEVDPHLARLTAENTRNLPNVLPIHDDGLRRADLLATHAKCWLTFAVDEVPAALLQALPEGGVIVAPVDFGGLDQQLLRYRRRRTGIEVDDLGPVRFVKARPLIRA